MTLILAAVCLSGLSVSKLLLAFDVRLMFARYLIAVCIAYAIFFLLIRLWLWYIGISPRARIAVSHSPKRPTSSSDGISFDLGTTNSSNENADWSGFGGGSSGGGGATDVWAEAPTNPDWTTASGNQIPSRSGTFNLGSSSSNSGGGSSSNIFDFDLGDDGCLAILVLLLLTALIFGIFGAGVYLIYQAPVIFTEVAFEAALASGLIKASKRIVSPTGKAAFSKLHGYRF